MRRIDWILISLIFLAMFYTWYGFQVWDDAIQSLDRDYRQLTLDTNRLQSEISHIPYDHQIIQGLQERMNSFDKYYEQDIPSRVYQLETKVFPNMHSDEDSYDF